MEATIMVMQGLGFREYWVKLGYWKRNGNYCSILGYNIGISRHILEDCSQSTSGTWEVYGSCSGV